MAGQTGAEHGTGWIRANGYWLCLVVIAGLLVAYAQRRDLYGRYLKYLESERQVREHIERLHESERETLQLERLVEDLDSDPVEVEAESRHRKNLVREGETVYRIVGLAESDAPAAAGGGPQ